LIGLEKRTGKIRKKIIRPIIAENKLILNKTYKPARRRAIHAIKSTFKAKPCHINGLSIRDHPFCMAQKIITVLEMRIRIKPVITSFIYDITKINPV